MKPPYLYQTDQMTFHIPCLRFQWTIASWILLKTQTTIMQTATITGNASTISHNSTVVVCPQRGLSKYSSNPDNRFSRSLCTSRPTWSDRTSPTWRKPANWRSTKYRVLLSNASRKGTQINCICSRFRGVKDSQDRLSCPSTIKCKGKSNNRKNWDTRRSWTQVCRQIRKKPCRQNIK